MTFDSVSGPVPAPAGDPVAATADATPGTPTVVPFYVPPDLGIRLHRDPAAWLPLVREATRHGVLPWPLAGREPELARLAAHPTAWPLWSDRTGGGWLLLPTASPGTLEVCLLFPATAPARRVLGASMAARRWALLRLPWAASARLVLRLPEGPGPGAGAAPVAAATLLAIETGFKRDFARAGAWHEGEGDAEGTARTGDAACAYYSLSQADYRRHERGLAPAGAWLRAALARLGVEGYPDDPALDAAAGLAVEHVAAVPDEAPHAVARFNAWAAQAGYRPVALVPRPGGGWWLETGATALALSADRHAVSVA